MATTLSRVRSGRCFKFSTTSLLVNLLVGYDHALRRWSKLAQLVPRKTGVAEHSIIFRESVGIAARRRSQHHQAKGRIHGRRDAILVGNELRCYRAAARSQRRVYLAQQSLVSRDIEMV